MTPIPMGVEIQEIPFVGYQGKYKGSETGKIILYLGTLYRFRSLDFLIRPTPLGRRNSYGHSRTKISGWNVWTRLTRLCAVLA